MIGIGILITPGILCTYLSGTGQILLVWLLGGCIALLGAVVYGQLGSLMPNSGGEFYYLSKLYHPFLGFTAGWVSLIAGFAGPIALASLAFSKYLLNFDISLPLISQSLSVQMEEKIISGLLIVLLCLMHYFRNRTALRFQLVLTILLILFLIIISFLGIRYGKIAISGHTGFSGSSVENGFGMAILLSFYSYTGWNAACYFAGEIINPKRNIPLSLFTGVSLVMVLYLAVNYGLLKILGLMKLDGQLDYLAVLGQEISGDFGHRLISFTVVTILLASISSMIFACSRIPVLINHPFERQIERQKSNLKISSPKTIWLQMGISLIFVLTFDFQQLLICLTIILTVFSMVTSFGIFLLPWHKLKVSKRSEWFVKLSAFLFSGVLLWLIINSFRMNFMESLLGLSLLLFGGLFSFLAGVFKPKPSTGQINTR